MRRLARRLALLLAPLFIAAGLVTLTTAPAQASTIWYMNCSHYAYRLTNFMDNSASDDWAKPWQFVNQSGNTQLVEAYYRLGSEPWQRYYRWGPGHWVPAGGSVYWNMHNIDPYWVKYFNFYIQVQDGNQCFASKRP